MVEDRKLDSVGQTEPHNPRPTIGLLIDNAWDPIAWDVWAAADDATRAADANLLCFVGGPLDSPQGFESQANALYELVSADTVDGLVLWAGGLARFVSPKALKAFAEQYRPLPMTAAALPLEGVPSVTVDNYQGMRQAVAHLIEVHGMRRIAFVRGPEGHPEAEERYRAYVEVLAEHGLPLDPELVVAGDFHADAGVQAVQTLLDERRLAPRKDFEAIAVVDDAAAIAVLETLQARSVRVPDKVAIVSFDNTEASGMVTPPLTTAPVKVYQQVRRATDMVLALLTGREAPERVTLSTDLIVRQSCGCLDPMIAQAAASFDTPTPGERRTGEQFQIAFAARRSNILSEVMQAAPAPELGLEPTWAEHLLGAFVVEAGGDAPGAFLTTMDRALRQTPPSMRSMAAWQNVISALREQLLPCLEHDPAVWSRAENLWQQARVMIGGVAERAGAYRSLQTRQRADLLRQLDQALMTVTSLSELTDALAQNLPRLNIPSCYLSLYEDPDAPGESSRLIMAYDREGRVDLEREGLLFPSRHLAPGGLYRRSERYSLILDALHHREETLGFVLFEMDPSQAELHAPLAADFSAALQKTLLTQKVKDHAIQLEAGADVSRAAGSILELDELSQKAVDLIRERFDLYYVGLFLIDEGGEGPGKPGGDLGPGSWAVLRAGTGEAGKTMVEEGHKLKVGGESMVGWCAANAQARIALNVGDVKSAGDQPGEDAARFDNPLLPDTRSEMALPLISRGRVIGAMSIQSDKPAAFSQDDITALQTMAEQLANAIANALLFEERERRLTELAIVSEIGQAFSSALALDEFLQVVHQQVGRLFDTTNFYIATYHEGSEEWVSAYHIEGGQRQPVARYSVSAGLTGHIIRTRQPILFRTLADNAVFHKAQGAKAIGPQACSWLGVPLIAADKVVGVMAIQNYEQEALYDEQDQVLFSTIATQVANALENLWLLDETRQRAAELEALHEVSLELAQEHRELDVVLETITQRTMSLLDSDGGGVWLWREEDGELELVITYQVGEIDFVGRRRKPGEGLSGQAFVEKTVLAVDDYASWAARSSVFKEVPFVSGLAAPMLWHAQVVGVLVVTRSQKGRPYNTSERNLAELLASQAAAIIEDARLHQETEHRLDELGTLSRLAQALAKAPLKAEETAEIICRQFMEIMGVQEVSVSLLVSKGKDLRVIADLLDDDGVRLNHDIEIMRLADFPATARVVETQEPLVVQASDPQADPTELAYMQQNEVDTLAIFPLVTKNHIIGIIELESWEGERVYTPQELSLAMTFANQAAVALENARLFDETQRRARQMEAINEIGRTIATVLDLEELLRHVVDITKSRFDHYFVSIMLVEGDRLIFRQGSTLGDSEVRFEPGGVGIDLLHGPSLNAEAARTGQPVLVNDALQDPRYLALTELPDTRSELDVPIEVKGRVVGVLSVQSNRPFAYDQTDVTLTQSLANQVGAAIDNARLFEETGRRAVELSVLNEMSRALGARLDTNAVIENLYHYSSQLMDTTNFYVALYDADRDEVSFPFYAEGDKVRRGGIRRAGEGLTEHVIHTCEAVLIKEDVDAWLEAQGVASIGTTAESWLGAPLAIGQQVIGVVAVQSYTTPRLYDERDRDLLSAIAGQGAIALHNAHLFEAEQAATIQLGQRVQELNILNDIGRKIDETPPMPDFLQWVVERIPLAMQNPDKCMAAIEYDGQIYGAAEAIDLPSQIVQTLYIGLSRVGRITIAYEEETDFLNVESALMGDISRRVSGYIENQRLLQETQHQVREMLMLYDVSVTAASGMAVEEALQAAVESITTSMGYPVVGVELVDPVSQTLVIGAAVGYPPVSDTDLPLSVGDGITGWVAQSGESLLIPDVRQDPRYVETVPDTRSEMCVPLIVSNQVIGVLNAESPQPDAFTEGDLRLLGTVAGNLGALVERLRLFEEARVHAEELAVLNELGQALTAHLDVDEVLNETYRQASRLLDTTNFHIALYDPEKEELSFAFQVTESKVDEELATAIPADVGFSGYIVRNRTSVLVEENMEQVSKDLGAEMAGEPPLSWLGVPLLLGDRVLGVMAAQSFTTPRAYGEHERDLLTAIASATAIAVQNAHLFAETQSALAETKSRAEELAVLNELNQALTARLDVDRVLEETYRQASRLIDTTNFYIALYVPEKEELHFRFQITESEEDKSVLTVIPADRGFSGRILQSRASILASDNVEALMDELGIERLGELAKSWLGVPLLSGDRVLGVMAAQSYTTPGAYGERERDLLTAIASATSIALQNANLFEETQVALAETESLAEELAVLNDLGQALSARLTVDEVLAKAYRGVARLVDARDFYVGLYDADKDEIIFPMDVTESQIDNQVTVMSSSEGATGWIVRNRQSVLIDGNMPEWLEEHGIELVGEAAQSWLGVPMMVGEQVMGVMAVQSHTQPGIYDEHDRDLLTTAANAMAIAIQNARLFEAEQAATLELGRRVQELDILNDIGRKIDETPSVPEFLHWLTAHIPAAMQYTDLCLVAIEFEGQVYGAPEALDLPSQMVQNLRIGGRQVGKLCIAYAKEREFLNEESAMMGDIGRRVGSYIENRHLFQQTEAALKETAVLFRIAQGLVQADDIDQMLEFVLTEYLDYLGFPQGGALLLDPVGDYGVLRALVREGQVVEPGLRIPIAGNSAMERLLATKRAVVIEDALTDELVQPVREIAQELGYRSLLLVPILVRGEVVGALGADTTHTPHTFTDREVALVQAIAGQVATVIERNRLLEQLQRRSVHLQTAAEVSRAASSILSVEELVSESVTLIRDRFDFYYVGLFLLNQDGDRAVLRAGSGEAGRIMVAEGHSLRVGGESMIGSCIADRQAHIALDVGDEPARFDNPLLPKTRSEMALPLIARGEALGALTVQSAEQAAFSEDDVAVLQTMGDQLANAIANARLFAQAEFSAQRSQALYETSSALSSQMEEEPLMRVILESVYRTLGCEHANISIADERAGVISSRHIIYKGEFDIFPDWIQKASYPLDDPDIIADIYRSGRTEIIGEWDERFNREIWDKYGHERLLRIFMPIQIRGHVLGVVEVAYDKAVKQSIDEEEVQLLATFMDQAAVALEQARLFEEAQIRADELAVLNELGQALTARLSVDEVLRETYRQTSRLVDTTNFYIALYDPERKEIRFAFDVTESQIDRKITIIPETEGIAGYMIRNRTSVLFSKDVRAQQEALGISMIGEESLSWLGVPLLIGDQILGAMAVHTFTTPGLYTEHDRDLLTAIASTTAIAVQNARLLEEAQSRAEREQTLRQITTRVHGSTDADAIMRTAVRELGAALGRPAFVRLGKIEQPPHPPTVPDGGNGDGTDPDEGGE